MKISKITREDLLAPLSQVSGIVERKHTLPVLSNVLVETNGGKLRMTAMDMELQISATSAVPVEQDEGITVSARKFQDLLRALPDGSDVTLETQGSKINVKSKRSRFQLQTLPASDFPKLTSAEEASVTLTLTQKVLKAALRQVEFAMALQDIRYYLNGVYWVLEGKNLELVATDGHRLAWAKLELDNEFERREVILPRKTMLELTKLIGDTEDPITVSLFQTQVGFSFGTVEMISKIIDGKFPDYGRVIPTGYTKHAELSRQALLEALQRAAILSNEKVRGVHLVFSPEELKIVCSNNEQEDAEEQIETQYNGDELDIGFNITYLLDVLQRLSCDKIVVSLERPESSALLTIPEDSNYKYVVMPMKI
jgi:DNA polymerase-3 subunit beta